MHIEVQPVNFFYDRILKRYGFYIIAIAFFQAGYSNVSAYVKLLIILFILIIPFLQLILYRADDIYILNLNNGKVTIKWKRFWMFKSVLSDISNVSVKVQPFLKGTYKMEILIQEGSRNLKIIQLSNKTWTIEAMNKLKMLVHINIIEPQLR